MEKLYAGLDIGGSETRVFALYNGSEVFKNENNLVLEYAGYNNTEDYLMDSEEFDDKLDLSIKIENSPKGDFKTEAIKITDKINNGRWILGSLARKISTNAVKLPLGQKVKHIQYYINVINGIINCMNEFGLKEVNLTLGLLLPARQYFDNDKDMINQILSGDITVVNNITKDTFVIHIKKENIIIKPETVVAFNECFIRDGKVTQLGQELSNKFNLAIDIGENTTDIAGIREGRPDPITFHSFDYAGGLLLQYLERELYHKLGYSPTRAELSEVVSTGYITQGLSREWVGEELSVANKEFANKLFNDFTQYYLLNKDIRIQQIAAFMFLGGGALKIDKVTSIGEYFIELAKEQSKNSVMYTPSDIRRANISGLANIIRVLTLK